MLNANNLALILLALGLISSLGLWLQMKVELRKREKSWIRDLEQLRFQLSEQRSSFIQLARRIDPTVALPPSQPVAPAIPATAAVAEAATREAVLKRYKEASLPAPVAPTSPTIQDVSVEIAKRGNVPQRATTALSIPKAHAEFLLKLQRARLQDTQPSVAESLA